MKTTKGRLVALVVLVGACALIYGAWRFYQRQISQQQPRAAFTAPSPSGAPNAFRSAAPPPQP